MKRGCELFMLSRSFHICSTEPTTSTWRENTCLSARRPKMFVATKRNTTVAIEAENAKAPIQMREYSMEIFSENAAANRNRKVVATTIIILSVKANGAIIG